MKMFIECVIPSRICNLRCDYCYVTQNKWWDSNKIDLMICKEKIGKALSINRIGGVSMVNICAQGETLLVPELNDIVEAILAEGHYIMIVTNGTISKKIEEFCEFPEKYRKRLFFKISFHYLELKNKKLLDCFFENIEKIKMSGISFSVELTPDDEYIEYINEIKQICMERLGALCHITVPRDERKDGFPLMTSLSKEEFVNVWSQFDSELFRFKESIFEEKRREFCYAGQWSIVLNLLTGEYFQCYKGKCLGNIYEEMEKKINLVPIGKNCKEGHCFNGHAFLGFGLIPEIKKVDYSLMRNRKTVDGSDWLSKEMESFMKQKLYDYNDELNLYEKAKFVVKNVLGVNKNE